MSNEKPPTAASFRLLGEVTDVEVLTTSDTDREPVLDLRGEGGAFAWKAYQLTEQSFRDLIAQGVELIAAWDRAV